MANENRGLAERGVSGGTRKKDKPGGGGARGGGGGDAGGQVHGGGPWTLGTGAAPNVGDGFCLSLTCGVVAVGRGGSVGRERQAAASHFWRIA